MISSLREEGAARGGGNPQKELSPGFAEGIFSTGIASTVKNVLRGSSNATLPSQSFFNPRSKVTFLKRD